MRVFHELSDEEIASLFHQRTLNVLTNLKDYGSRSVVLPSTETPRVEVLGIGYITVSTELYEVYCSNELLLGYYQTSGEAVCKLMEREV